jgi:hypothetical protein
MPTSRKPLQIISIGRPDPARAGAVLGLLGLRSGAASFDSRPAQASPRPLKRGARSARQDAGAGARRPD